MYDRADIPVPERPDLSAFGPHWQARQRATDRMSAERWREITALYLGMVSLIDDCVGRVLGALDERGLAENTVVAFVNDHGELLGDHGLLLKGPFLLESMIRQVQLWRGPGVRSGATDEGLAESVDIMPTVLELAGIEAPAGVEGVSLAPRLAGDAPGGDAALVQFSPWTRYDGGGFPDGPDRLHLNAIITDTHKLVEYVGQPFGELFDLRADPGELHNLWDDPGHKDLRAELIDALHSRLGPLRSPLPERTARY
ncbi:MAG: sulfatase-like hydrolase/transferase, partial [Armatimonadetes bacterium]|nr:sulfatase-like hydrolase/transferase [Armatimonadota bacterium]